MKGDWSHLKFRRIFLKAWAVAISVVILIVFLSVIFLKKQSNSEYAIVQSIIKDLSLYEKSIEDWGYRVSVLSDLDSEPDCFGFKRYYWQAKTPVLVLTDEFGGMWCFYCGFDQYFMETSYTDNMQLTQISQHADKEYIDAKKVVQLKLYKSDISRSPAFENNQKPGSNDYYDIQVQVYINSFSLENNMPISTYANGFYTTNYCSNNFSECSWWSGLDPESANRYSDSHIKQEFSSEELLMYYRQGLDLQKRLFDLYSEKLSQEGEI